MRIAEIYKSIQGEGLLTGTESTFVRASGCNLRCWFCDTPYTSWKPTGEDLSVEEILSSIRDLGCDHIVLTGGEPMLFAEIIPLCRQLHREDYHITIETAGTLHLPVVCDLMSISPKTSGSAPSPREHAKWYQRHESTRHRPEVMRRLMDEYTYQLKFVVDTPSDLDDLSLTLDQYDAVDGSKVYLMPQGTEQTELLEREAWLKPYCESHNYQFCPRMQIAWFGAQQGT
ncbi:MAG: 7-carboxy-7-deazaguanine synthase QueE [Pirellulaceae bacterium]